MTPAQLDILFAAERLLPPTGGAERFVLELLAALARRHRVRALWLTGGALEGLPPGVEPAAVRAPRASGGYWRAKRVAREAVANATARALDLRPANIVLTQLHAAPGAISAAARARVASVLLLPSYESLCKNAFDVGARCGPYRDCRRCPAALALPSSERPELRRSRDAHERSLAAATALVAPSVAVAGACEAWCGRRPLVVPFVAARPARVSADPRGHALLPARWSENKGAGLLEPLVRSLDRRPAVVAGPLAADLRSRLVQLPNVRLVPEAPFPELLAGAALTLVPSQWPEPFGRTAFESLAAGVPTLASAVGGLREFVPPEQLVSPPGSQDAWAAALERLWAPVEWERARRRGSAAAQRLLATRPVERVEELLLGLVT